MLRMRSCILTHLLSSPSSAYSISPLHCLFSTTVSPIPANPTFAVQDYLVTTCGLTRAQALKASTKLSHLKSPSRPDAVLAFLAGLGLSGADVTSLVAKDPQFLCASVEKTLAPVVAGLTGHGLSHTEIARLFPRGRAGIFRCRSIVSNLPYYLSLVGSYDNLLRLIKKSSIVLGHSLEKVKPNVAFLKECGLGDCEISKICFSAPWILITKLERLRAMVACAEGLGVPRGSGMFRHVLHAVSFTHEEEIAATVDNLKKTFRWTDAEVGIVVCKAPMLLTRCKDKLQRLSEFLISEVGLEPAFIARRPVMLTLSLDGRLRPRYHVVKFLKENGLIKPDPNYDTIFKLTDKVFLEKYICPHKEAAPHLAQDYVAACKGGVSTRRFMFA